MTVCPSAENVFSSSSVTLTGTAFCLGGVATLPDVLLESTADGFYGSAGHHWSGTAVSNVLPFATVARVRDAVIGRC